MKRKWFVPLLCACLMAVLSVPAILTAAATAAEDYVLSRKVSESEEGFIVNLKMTAAACVRAEIEPLTVDTYVAVRIRLKNVSAPSGDQFFPVQISVNNALLTGENFAENAVNADGWPITVEQKWGDWFFIPPGFDGTLYLEKAKYFSGTDTVTSLTFTGDGARSATFNVLSVYTCRAQGDVAGESVLPAYTADDGFAVTDGRVTGMDYTAYTRIGRDYYDVSVVQIYDDMTDGLKIKVKDAFSSGVKQVGYGWLDINLGDAAFTPSTGLALTVACLYSECYFKVRMTDANGTVWTAAVTESFDQSDRFPFTVDELPASLRGFYGAFYMTRGDKGTLYIDYGRFVPSATDAVMTDIVKVSVGMDMEYGLGRCMAVNTIADVNAPTGTVTRVLSLSQVDDGAIDAENGTVVSSPDEPGYRSNFLLSRTTEEDFAANEGSAIPAPENGYVTVVPSLGGKKKGCGSETAAASLPAAAVMLAAALFMRKKEDRA